MGDPIVEGARSAIAASLECALISILFNTARMDHPMGPIKPFAKRSQLLQRSNGPGAENGFVRITIIGIKKRLNNRIDFVRPAHAAFWAYTQGFR